MLACEVLDYAALDSLEEFQECIQEKNFVFAVDKGGTGQTIAYGSELLNAMAHEVIPMQELRAIGFAIDYASDQVEHLCAALQVSIGLDEWPLRKGAVG